MTHPLAGRKQSPEHIAKRVAAWRQSSAREKAVERCIAMGKASAGRKQPEAYKAHMRVVMKGKRNALGCSRSEGFRKALSAYWKDNPNHNHWIDGKGHLRTSERVKDQGRLEYRLWREAVFKRDNWTCQSCQHRGSELHADHIKPYSKHPELRYEVSNGRTLCAPCHRATDTYGSKVHRT